MIDGDDFNLLIVFYIQIMVFIQTLFMEILMIF